MHDKNFTLSFKDSIVKQFFSDAISILDRNLKLQTNDNVSILDIYQTDTFTDIDRSFKTQKTITDISHLYENCIPNDIRKDYGQFYTNEQSLIKLMFTDKDLLSGKILEPSCGAGNFVITIIERLILLKEKLNAVEIIEYIQHNLYANDIDTIALKITEMRMIITLFPLIVKAYIQDKTFKLQKFKLYNIDFITKDCFSEKFSLVIGNPPFVTMYGKMSRNMSEEKRAYFNTFDFVKNKKGNNKFNLSMFFIENGLKLLKSNGKLSFILDISFFETAFTDIRSYLLSHYNILNITKGFSIFQGVASGQMLLKVSNDFDIEHTVDFVDINANSSFKIKQQSWNNKANKYKFVQPLSKFSESITKKLYQYPTIDFYFPNKSLRTCCALTGKTEEFIVDPNIETKCLCFPYIEGSKGLYDCFGSLSFNRYIKYDYELQLKISDEFKEELEKLGVKNKKRVTLGDKDAYLSPKVFIRQSANKIISTYTEDPYAANNSIYILTSKSNKKADKDLLKYTCGILNSKLITFFCKIHKIIRFEKGKTPQIKISDLKTVRLNVNEDNYYNIIDIVDKLLKNPLDKELKDTLNNIVYNIYNISKDEQAYIESYLINN
jgi:SAM-dependent methyltransferase